MKTNILKLTAIILLFTVSANHCEREEAPTLPPETQEGKNTFGCYINDDLFVRIRKYRSPVAEYKRKTNTIVFGCAQGHPRITLYVDKPCESEYNSIIFGEIGHSFNDIVETGCWSFVCENGGQVFITKFDTINHIVSGTFEFSAKCAADSYGPSDLGNIIYPRDSIVHVKNGRFDIKFDIVNE